MMRRIHRPRTPQERRYRRHLRVRRKIMGTPDRPRLVVYRSLKHIYAQLVDDTKGITVLGLSDMTKDIKPEGPGKVARCLAVGKLLAERAKANGVSVVVFDRGGYLYHGRVMAVAEGARQGGLEF